MMCSIMRLFLFITGNLWDRLKSFLPRASYSFFLRLDYSNRFAVDEGGNGFSDNSRDRLPLGHGAHDQHDEARRHCDRHFRFDG
jgi:hypothetical protein